MAALRQLTCRIRGLPEDGFAHERAAAQWFKNNLLFEADEGKWRAGRQIGYGTQVWPSGRYDSELVDGEPRGPGELILQPNRAGTLIRGGGSIRGTWTDRCFREGPFRRAVVGLPIKVRTTELRNRRCSKESNWAWVSCANAQTVSGKNAKASDTNGKVSWMEQQCAITGNSLSLAVSSPASSELGEEAQAAIMGCGAFGSPRLPRE